jgi:hypothetical protein
MRPLLFIASLFLLGRASAQVCDPAGNLFLFSNYDGGIVTINVDEDIPNLVIGISTYEPVQVTITGPFAGNVTQVLYAGMNSSQNNNNCGQGNFTTTVVGVPPNIVTINPPMQPPQVGYTPAHNNGTGPWGGVVIGAAGGCDTTVSTGGVNTPDELVFHFEDQTGATLYAHFTQYACWQNDVLNLSDGGTCCIDVTPPDPITGCDPLGNVMIYSNYDGGQLTINVDQDIPDLRIGICTYEAVAVNFIGPFVGNITAVIYAGFDGGNNNCGNNPPTTTITGVPANIVTQYSQTLGNIAIANFLGEPLGPGLPPLVNCITGAEGECSTSNSGGGNSAPQIAQFFLAEFGAGSTLFGHQVQYDCFDTPFNLSDGGNCCLTETGTPPNPIYAGNATYDFIPYADTLLCAGPITIDLSFYPVLFQPPTYPGYVWSDGTTGPVITITQPGTYSFIVGDYCHYATGNWLTDTVVVLPCCSIGGVDTSSTAITCNGASDGSITVTPLGNGPFTYSWNTVPAQSTPTVGGLDAGLYSVVIDNGAGCDTTLSFTLNDPAPITVELLGDTELCLGDVATVTATVLGGVGSVDLDWGTLGTGTQVVFTAADTTLVTATATDANGCTATSSLLVNVSVCCPTYAIAAVATDPLCAGGADGSIAVSVNTSDPLTYSWNTVPVQTTATASGLNAGSYTVLISNAQGCDTLLTYTLVEPAPLSVAVTGTSPVCAQQETTISALAQGGTGTIALTWSPQGSGSSYTFTAAADVDFVLTATDANGCSASASFNLVVAPAPIVSFTSSADTLCAGEEATLSANAAATDVLLWDLGPAGTSTATNPVVNYTSTGDQPISLTATNAAGCTSAPFIGSLFVAAIPTVLLTAEQNGCARSIRLLAVPSSSATLSLTIDGLEQPITPGANSYAVDGPGTYSVHVLASNAAGCADSVTAAVTIDDALGLFMPNVFTPDNDGINDAFGMPYLVAPRIFELLLFNRWGQEVFRSSKPTELWKAEGVPDGVYYYLLRTEDPCDASEVRELRGHVTVLR